jgi:AAA domain/CHC2 zinc finger
MSKVDPDLVARARAVDLRSEVERRGFRKKKEGSKNWVGGCPFCGGTDRFSINKNAGTKNRWMYHCRWCEGNDEIGDISKGDAIDFVMRYDRVDFQAAVERLTGERRKASPVKREIPSGVLFGGDLDEDGDEPRPRSVAGGKNNGAQMLDSPAPDSPHNAPEDEYVWRVIHPHLVDLYEAADGTKCKAHREDFVNKRTGKPYIEKNGKPRKKFIQSRSNGNGWIPGTKDLDILPYAYNELLAAPNGETVYVVENGEFARAMHAHGFLVTQNVGGARQWKRAHHKYLKGKKVIVVVDCDEAGIARAKQFERELPGIAASVHVMRFEGLKYSQGPDNWVANGIAAGKSEAQMFTELKRRADAGEWGERFDYLWDKESEADNSEESKPDTRFEPIWLKDINVDDEPVFLIEGILPAGPALGEVAGKPKSLKSFALKDKFLHIAIGKSYGGRKVQQGAAIYITSEGVRGVKRRAIAMRRHHDVEGKDIPFALIPVMPNLGTDENDLKILIEKIEDGLKKQKIESPLRIIGIDTLRKATPGKDENSAKDMSTLIANVMALSEKFKCLVILVHRSQNSAAAPLSHRRGLSSSRLRPPAGPMRQRAKGQRSDRSNPTDWIPISPSAPTARYRPITGRSTVARASALRSPKWWPRLCARWRRRRGGS